MATVIDSLVVKLGLDSSDFEQGEKRVAAGLDKTRKSTDRVGGDISASGKKAAEFFGQLEKAALKFFAVLTVGRGMADFTRTVISGGAQLDRMSTRLGTSADTLSRWQGAVRQSGGTGEGLLNTLQGLSNEMTQIAVTGESSLIPMLGFLGVSLKDSNGQAKSTVDLLKDIGDAANAKIADKGNRFNILQSMGIDEGTINLLMKGGAERDRLLASQKAYSDADARSARLAQEKWEGVKLNIERTSQAIVIKLLPVLERLTNAMLKFADTAVPILLQVGGIIGDLDDKTNGWSTALIGVLATLRLIGGAGVLSGITRLAGSLGGVIASALLLKGDAAEGNGQMVSKEDAALSARLSKARGGDRDEAIALAKEQLGHWWNIGVTEKDIQDRADSIMRGERGGVAPKPAGAPQSSTGGTRAQRNNNPGNLEYQGQRGAVREDGPGRFAKFGSPEEGVQALARQLQLYGKRGIDTIEEIIKTYAPANENNTQAYIDAMTKRMGVAPNEQLDLNNPTTLSGLIKGISRHESGSDYLTDQQVMTGVQRNSGRQGGSDNSVTIGNMNLYTQATDAAGIAREFRGAMVRQADTGVR